MINSLLPVYPIRALLTLGVALMLAAPGLADDRAEREQRLRALQQQIEKLTQAMEVKEDSKSHYIKQLKSIERDIGEW